MSGNDLQYKVLIGLEIHVQLNTASKMFCACPNQFGAEPNSNVCEVCLGMPGVLPVMNRRAYELAVKTAMALNCKIATFTKWDRKSYYYPDLPKNYQISQYDLPLSYEGYFEIPVNGQLKKVRIRRLHLEEDAGKLLHEGPGGGSRVDLNRAGTPLMEIVTEPDINGAEEARIFGTELRNLVRYLGVSEANIQEGQMRLEPNINLIITRDGRQYRTPITEVKNLGSLKALENAVAYEIQRQLDHWQRTGETAQAGNKTTRGWDDARGVTVLQREKEEAHDYRYFPDPDLVPVTVQQAWLDEMKARMPELPVKRRLRFQQQLGLSANDAATIVADRATADLFEQALANEAPVKTLTNQFISFWSMLANERNCSIAELNVGADRVAGLAKMVDDEQINATAAAAIAGKMLESPDPPQVIAERENLMQVSDAGELEKIVDQILAANEKAVQDALKPGKKQKKAMGFLLGQVMQKTKGQSNPKIAGEIIERKLSAMSR